MNKVQVKMLRTQAGPSLTYKKGHDYEIDADKAERWITNKIAISLGAAVETAVKNKKVETAVKK